jgi:peptidoglycan hydrolase CwlO-like protein
MSYTQVASQVEQAKATIESLQQALQDAKEKQSLAYEEVKKLERDMEEFKNNKEGKIEELKVHVYPFSRPHASYGNPTFIPIHLRSII